jgi:hypothetical protein
MKCKVILLFLILCFWQTQLYAQFRERVYLQTDKQLYISGELLWMKLYTTDTVCRLTSFSKIGYVELINDSIPEIQVKIDIQDGVGAGWIELPAMLPTGFYRLIAYTRYMRNETEDAFFEKTIAILNPFIQNNNLFAGESTATFSYKAENTFMQSVDLSVDKPYYAKRNKGEVRLKGLPAENISLGISITGIEPDLTINTSITDWKQQLSIHSETDISSSFLPEYEGAIIDGILIDLETRNPSSDSQNINLLSFPGKEIQLFAGKADNNGQISFYTKCTIGKEILTTTSITQTDKNYRIDIQSPFAWHTPTLLPLFNPDSTWIDYLQKRNLFMQVTSKYTADSLSKVEEPASCFNLRPHSRYILDDYTRFATMEDTFIEFILFARVRRTIEGRRFSIMNELLNNYTNNVLVLLDNIPITNHELMLNYNPQQIKTIDIHIGRYLFGGHIFEGIISFYSYKNDYPSITFGENTQLYDYKGTQPYRYFYVPSYNDHNIDLRTPDFRHTLLWEPFLKTAGQSELTIPFTTSDIPGKYLILIEGIGTNGSIVKANQLIEIE